MMTTLNRTDLRRRNLVSPLPSLSYGLQLAASSLLVMTAVWPELWRERSLEEGLGVEIKTSPLAQYNGAWVPLCMRIKKQPNKLYIM